MLRLLKTREREKTTYSKANPPGWIFDTIPLAMNVTFCTYKSAESLVTQHISTIKFHRQLLQPWQLQYQFYRLKFVKWHVLWHVLLTTQPEQWRMLVYRVMFLWHRLIFYHSSYVGLSFFDLIVFRWKKVIQTVNVKFQGNSINWLSTNLWEEISRLKEINCN